LLLAVLLQMSQVSRSLRKRFSLRMRGRIHLVVLAKGLQTGRSQFAEAVVAALALAEVQGLVELMREDPVVRQAESTFHMIPTSISAYIHLSVRRS
jgi:hypothetical protein